MEDEGLPLPPVRCLSKEQAAHYLGIGVTLFAELQVPYVRFGRRCVWDRVDLDAWLEEHKGERRRASDKEDLWPVTKGSTEGRILGTGGSTRRSPTAHEYAKVLGLKTDKRPKRI